MSKVSESWVLSHFTWVSATFFEFWETLIYWATFKSFENLSFAAKKSEFWWKPEFLSDLSFGPNAQTKSLDICKVSNWCKYYKHSFLLTAHVVVLCFDFNTQYGSSSITIYTKVHVFWYTHKYVVRGASHSTHNQRVRSFYNLSEMKTGSKKDVSLLYIYAGLIHSCLFSCQMYDFA